MRTEIYKCHLRFTTWDGQVVDNVIDTPCPTEEFRSAMWLMMEHKLTFAQEVIYLDVREKEVYRFTISDQLFNPNHQ